MADSEVEAIYSVHEDADDSVAAAGSVKETERSDLAVGEIGGEVKEETGIEVEVGEAAVGEEVARVVGVIEEEELGKDEKVLQAVGRGRHCKPAFFRIFYPPAFFYSLLSY